MKTIDWYFDFISPFAYLQSHKLDDFADNALVRCKPILFAALLNHWGHKGPAEMPTKRVWTFEHVAWLAHKHGIAITMPAMHPFVPLRLLRLSVLLGNSVADVRRLFAFVWRDGNVPTDDAAWAALLHEFGVSHEEVESTAVKQTVKSNTEEAIARGVFGVPTCAIGEALFWGFDATDMVHGYLRDDPFFASEALASARTMPQGVQRRTT